MKLQIKVTLYFGGFKTPMHDLSVPPQAPQATS